VTYHSGTDYDPRWEYPSGSTDKLSKIHSLGSTLQNASNAKAATGGSDFWSGNDAFWSGNDAFRSGNDGCKSGSESDEGVLGGPAKNLANKKHKKPKKRKKKKKKKKQKRRRRVSEGDLDDIMLIVASGTVRDEPACVLRSAMEAKYSMTDSGDARRMRFPPIFKRYASRARTLNMQPLVTQDSDTL
jgi:hypothetical protein